MVYMGSKNRIADEILQAIRTHLNISDFKDYSYVEPFVGGANVICKVEAKKKVGADNNKYLIALFRYLQSRTITQIQDLPNEISREEHYKVRDCWKQKKTGSYPDWYIGFVGFCSSYGSKFFGGYVSMHSASSKSRNSEMIANLKKQWITHNESLKNTTFIDACYTNLTPSPSSIIYCDPPYVGKTGYSNQKFNHEEFYDWCIDKSKQGHKVFISEYAMPEDRFICIWEKPLRIKVGFDNKKQALEKLFVPI